MSLDFPPRPASVHDRSPAPTDTAPPTPWIRGRTAEELGHTLTEEPYDPDFDLFGQYICNELSRPERREVERRYRDDPVFRAAVEPLARMLVLPVTESAVRKEEAAEAGAATRGRAMRTSTDDPRRHPWWARLPWFSWHRRRRIVFLIEAGVIAFLLLCATAYFARAWYVIWRTMRPDQVHTLQTVFNGRVPISARNSALVQAGGVDSPVIELPDSAVAMLRPWSRLSYLTPMAFWQSTPVYATLTGEMVIDVGDVAVITTAQGTVALQPGRYAIHGGDHGDSAMLITVWRGTAVARNEAGGNGDGVSASDGEHLLVTTRNVVRLPPSAVGFPSVNQH